MKHETTELTDRVQKFALTGLTAAKQHTETSYLINDLHAAVCDRDREIETLMTAVKEVGDTIHAVETRCMAVDGPVSKTSDEITELDLKRIWKAVKEWCA